MHDCVKWTALKQTVNVSAKSKGYYRQLAGRSSFLALFGTNFWISWYTKPNSCWRENVYTGKTSIINFIIRHIFKSMVVFGKSFIHRSLVLLKDISNLKHNFSIRQCCCNIYPGLVHTRGVNFTFPTKVNIMLSLRAGIKYIFITRFRHFRTLHILPTSIIYLLR